MVFTRIFLRIFCGRIFQGRHLRRGSRLEDFDIKVGDAACVPVSVTDNQVECGPPTDKPNRNVNDTFCVDDTLSTDVCIHVTYCIRSCFSQLGKLNVR